MTHRCCEQPHLFCCRVLLSRVLRADYVTTVLGKEDYFKNVLQTGYTFIIFIFSPSDKANTSVAVILKTEIKDDQNVTDSI